MDIRARNRHEPPDIYRNDPIAEPVAADDRDGYERHHSVESATGPHQHHRQLSVSSRLHRDDAQRRHGRSHEYRRRLLWRRLCVPGAVDIPWARRVVKDRIIAVPIDRAAPVTFLRTAFHEDDWVAVFLKSYQSGRVAQRVRPVQQIQSAKFQAWLRAENAAGANVYVSVNTLAPHQRSRRRDAVREIRHVFLDADSAAQEVLDAIETATAPAQSVIRDAVVSGPGTPVLARQPVYV